MSDRQHVIITILLLWVAPNLYVLLCALDKHLTCAARELSLNVVDLATPSSGRGSREPVSENEPFKYNCTEEHGVDPGTEESSTSRKLKVDLSEDSLTARQTTRKRSFLAADDRILPSL
jgi:hypothetical protein